MKRNRIIWGVVSLVVLFTGAVSFGAFESLGQENNSLSKVTPTMTPTPEIRDTRDLSKYGKVDYSAARENPSSKRFSTNKRYDGQGSWVVSSVNPYTGGIGRVTEDPPPPLFPIDESSLIVAGEVVAVNAFLSNDRGSVYTEFTIRIDESLKNNSSGKEQPEKVTADREGGVVVYPGGQRVLYQDSDLGLPRLGSKYLFFLKKDGPSPNYRIITSYDLDGNKIRQVEMGQNFDEFKNSDQTIFLEKVRNKIAGTRNQ
jgi:hypothetical protein